MVLVSRQFAGVSGAGKQKASVLLKLLKVQEDGGISIRGTTSFTGCKADLSAISIILNMFLFNGRNPTGLLVSYMRLFGQLTGDNFHRRYCLSSPDSSLKTWKIGNRVLLNAFTSTNYRLLKESQSKK